MHLSTPAEAHIAARKSCFECSASVIELSLPKLMCYSVAVRYHEAQYSIKFREPASTAAAELV